MLLNNRAGIWRHRHQDHIQLDVPAEVRYWTGVWGLSDQELRDAVAAVGSIAANVASYLGQPLRGEDLTF